MLIDGISDNVINNKSAGYDINAKKNSIENVEN